MLRVMGEHNNRKSVISSLDNNKNLQQQYNCPQCNPVDSKTKKPESNMPTSYIDFLPTIETMMKNLDAKNQIYILEQLTNMAQKIEKNTEHIVGRVIRTDPDDSTSELITNEEKIKEIILKNTTKDEPFYPDDLAFEHNMDLEKTMNVTCQLQSEGYVE